MYRKQAAKEAPAKITTVIHCTDEDLKHEPDVQLGYKNKVLWSSVEDDIRCKGNNRMFDKIVAQGKAYEENVILRKKKLAAYF